MAHAIESIAYVGQRPWHRLGTALEEADLYDWPAASRKAGLDWEVELVPLVTADTQAQVAQRAVRRTSDARVLGVVGPRYAPLQNRDAFAWFQPFLDAREAALHTAGSLRSGSRIWVLAKLKCARPAANARRTAVSASSVGTAASGSPRTRSARTVIRSAVRRAVRADCPAAATGTAACW
jgi:Domain of unknown function (DUF932)